MSEIKLTLSQKLLEIQKELKVPKGQTNTFGGYKFRSAEDILEAAKPICHKQKTTITLDDDIFLIGDRYYIRGTAILECSETGDIRTKSAYAREPLNKKGMDESQITGTASSYARKYALNGLFALDDTKDADTDEHAKVVKETPKATKQQVARIIELFEPSRIPKMLQYAKVEKLEDLTLQQASDFIKKQEKML